ncbi:MAG TPA: histidine kinase dimerization/phospho-acceptor domain-containing protein, partial [Verrucomicrobiae bacterium]|nr:histidine kinase dimerization/phospho-acceptor domain-containing protein [Verrucomicrobiae bacterium]
MNRPEPEPEPDGLNFLQVLRHCLVAGAIIVDGKGQISAFTPEAEKITALPAAKALGHSIEVLPAPLQKIIHNASASVRQADDAELEFKSAAGTKIAVRVQATPLRNWKSKGGVIVVLNDITPARRLEENMRRLNRLASVGTLSAGTAHEIKNALVAVKTFTDLLLEKHSDTDLVKVVRREMGRIDALVSQVLKFARPGRS